MLAIRDHVQPHSVADNLGRAFAFCFSPPTEHILDGPSIDASDRVKELI